MAKLQSPGQKRKKIVPIIAVVLFIATTYAGSLVSAYFKDAAYAWADDHQQTMAAVVDLSSEESEYRGLRGRTLYETMYLVTYDFEVDQDTFGDTIEVSEPLYYSLQQGGTVSVWYASDDPYVNDVEANIESAVASNTPLGNLFSAAPFTAGFSLLTYFLLSTLFTRESKKKLVLGFFTENSWLDIDDHQVVFLKNDELFNFTFDKKITSEVQQAYQENKSLDELISISKTGEVKQINLRQITQLISDHNSDAIHILIDDTLHSIGFLNQAIKAHALKRIQSRLPADLDYNLNQKSRIGAATPPLVILLLLCFIEYFVDWLLLNVMLALISIVGVIPTIFPTSWIQTRSRPGQQLHDKLMVWRIAKAGVPA